MFRVMPYLPWEAWTRSRRLKAGRAIMLQVVERARHRAARSSIVTSLEALKLTDAELADEILVIILAGHHTTGSVAAWLLYFLGTKPDLAADLAREAAQVTNASGDIVASRLAHAAVSRATALEVLRLYPPSYWYSRETRRPMEVGSVRLKAGSSLIISPWQLHRDSRFWRQPETFDINRAHMANRAYVPFGSGPRACVGMGLALLELQLIALELASSCEVVVINSDLVGLPRPAITLVPPPIRLTVRPRQTLVVERSIA
jgi:cytochrome P450